MTIVIADALSAGQAQEAFLRLPHEVYAEDPAYAPPDESADLATLERSRYAGRQAALLASVGGRPVARILARLVPELAPPGASPLGCLGLFEALPLDGVGEALLGEAAARLKAEGARTVLGPMEGDVWHPYRLNVGPFVDPPFAFEPWHPPYYSAVWRAAGFVVEAHYLSVRLSDLEISAARWRPHLDASRAAGYRFRTFDASRAEDELATLHALSLECFRRNLHYTPLSRDEFMALYRPYLAILQPELVPVAVDRRGEPVGFLFSFIDEEAEVLTFNVKTIAVVPTHRRRGLASALCASAADAARSAGAMQANLCLMHEGNVSRRLVAGLGHVLRRYELLVHGGAP